MAAAAACLNSTNFLRPSAQGTVGVSHNAQLKVHRMHGCCINTHQVHQAVKPVWALVYA